MRTFIGVALDPAVRARVARLVEAWSRRLTNVRWVTPENLHYTLHFLGDVDDTDLHPICRGAIDVCRDFPTFSLEVAGVGAFPKVDRPRTLWVGAREGREQLIDLHGGLAAAIRELGFRGENRPFAPHLTIGRVQGRGGPGGEPFREVFEQDTEFHAGSINVLEVTVFGSELTPAGPSYHVIGRAPLAGG